MGNFVISIKKGEKLHIGEKTIVFVMEAKGGWVKLSVKAPKEVKLEKERCTKIHDKKVGE